MKYTLTKDASLFFIDGNQFEEFSQLMNYTCECHRFEQGLLEVEDVVHNSFNLWLMMQPVSKEVMESMEKTMYYTGDFLIFDAIRKHKIFHQLQKSVGNDEVRKCKIATCLANQLNIWLLEKMGNLKTLSIFQNHSTTYFLLYKRHDLWENRLFLDEIALYTKHITSALSDQLRFEQIFIRAASQLEQLTSFETETKRA
ncbi:hypothetical protein [Kurthia sibirica]|uniref:Uncharacterized protein n=1 Tax=Kurthia sibirica TaxID=202750 RepID=A0A2U3ANF0_9BACL|nr:hypothetical protein [Kurthia sibirica]PWI26064.1 hypothetical protein DEX24_05915 [Kurthia sibirica]GEK34785.1 hypothetical protein KSI01_23180 [Kurthia sibirica]